MLISAFAPVQSGYSCKSLAVSLWTGQNSLVIKKFIKFVGLGHTVYSRIFAKYLVRKTA